VKLDVKVESLPVLGSQSWCHECRPTLGGLSFPQGEWARTTVEASTSDDQPAREAEEETHAHDPIGEIYIMGVHPDYSGRGFGSAITIAGLQHIRYHGIFSAMLYVESQNESALKLYRGLGFTEWGRDVLYKLSGS
jgi:ribosomal protein S18 acetylase RimI-like enzyme